MTLAPRRGRPAAGAEPSSIRPSYWPDHRTGLAAVLLLSTGMFALMSAPTGDAPPTKEPDDSIGALALINVPVVEPKAPNPPPLLEAMGRSH